jgi:predicted transcriptional regulator
MNLSPTEYKKIIDNQQTQIDELCAILHAIRGNKIANHMPFVARLIQERNQLEIQRAEAVQQFLEVNSILNKCKVVAEHFDYMDIEKSPLKG